MSISVDFPEPRDTNPAKGSAGLPTRMCGQCTTVSALTKAGIIRKSIG